MNFPSPDQVDNLLQYLKKDIGLSSAQTAVTALWLVNQDFFSGNLALVSHKTETEIHQKLIPALPLEFYEKTKN